MLFRLLAENAERSASVFMLPLQPVRLSLRPCRVVRTTGGMGI